MTRKGQSSKQKNWPGKKKTEENLKIKMGDHKRGAESAQLRATRLSRNEAKGHERGREEGGATKKIRIKSLKKKKEPK